MQDLRPGQPVITDDPSVIGTVNSRCFAWGFLLGVAVGSGFDHAGKTRGREQSA